MTPATNTITEAIRYDGRWQRTYVITEMKVIVQHDEVLSC